MRAVALNAVLRGRRPTLDDAAPASVRKALEGPGAKSDREVREFKEVYGALVPWYGLRARAIAGHAEDWSGLVSTVQKECRTEGWGWRGNSELGRAINEIGGIWFEALLWSGRGTDTSAAEVDTWLADQQVMISIPTWTGLARRAAHHHESCRDSALKFAQRAREIAESSHADARQTADEFAALARATLPLGYEEASSYFQKALEHLSRLGDELHERLFSILALAGKAATIGRPDPREAYRVARIGELFHDYNDHKFPWSDVITAVVQLCPASAFAVASRWHDRNKVSLEETLPWVALQLLESGIIPPTVAAALHSFGGYWEIHKQAALFLDSARDRELRQAVLDTLALDQEYDPDREESAVDALLDVAERHDLERHRLQGLVHFRAQMPDQHDHSAWNRADRDQEVAPAPVWGDLMMGIALHTPDGVDEAIRRRQATKGPSDWQEFLTHIRRAVEPDHRPDHMLALARSEEMMIVSALGALEACAKDWGASIAVEQALADSVKIMAKERAAEVVGRGWGFHERVRQCAELSGLSFQDVLARLMQGMVDQVENVPASTLFYLAGALAGDALSPEQAKDALAFGLDRLEPILADDDGDGPWRDDLAPPLELPRAIAGFLYAMLASPKAELRWRAAHAVRRLCRFGEVEIVSALIDLLPTENHSAFTGVGLPFYAMHARLYLLIALARAAEEAPDLLARHVQVFVQWSLEATPHVLIRHFAAHAALDLERNRPGLLDTETVDRLTAVNASPFPAEGPQKGQPTGWTHQTAGKTERFTFDYDFDRYWLGDLAGAFNLSHAVVAERAEDWIVDRWGKANLSGWDRDARARRNLYGDDTYASHGSYPSVDRYSFYLSYHAMFCTAGELLAEFPSSIRYGEDGWRDWLERHLLTRPDGKWLADRRDVEPLEMRRWELKEDDWERRDEWPYSVMAEDFDIALGVGDKMSTRLAVAGRWFARAGEREETIHVSSALVSPGTSMALLRALQTVDNPYDCWIPEERDELEVNLPGFRLCGWIADPHNETRLDQFDPFAGKIPWPGPHPGRRARRLLKLVGDADGRIWRLDDEPVMELQIWGNRGEDRYRSVGNHGNRLAAELDFLLAMLRRLDANLIIKVEVERKYGRQETSETDFAYRRYTRIYLLRGDGRFHTLYGCRRIRAQVG